MSESESGSRVWIIVLLVVLLAVAAVGGGGVCLCGGLGFLVAKSPEMDRDEELAQQEGTRDGRVGTTDSCVRAAHERAAACGGFETFCQVSAQDYLGACLHAVPSADLSVCEGAPEHPGLLTDPTYLTRVCSRYGFPNAESDLACDTVVASLERYCAVAVSERALDPGTIAP